MESTMKMKQEQGGLELVAGFDCEPARNQTKKTFGDTVSQYP